MGLTIEHMQPVNLKRQEGSEVGPIIGIHRISMFDMRSPSALKVQKDIEGFLAEQQHIMRSVKRNIASAILNDDDAAEKYWKSQIEWRKRSHHKGMTDLYQQLRDISVTHDHTVHNIIPTVGRSVIARWIIGDNTFDANNGANFGSLGTGTASPANGNTQLATEVYRKARSSEAQSSNVAVLSNFYTATEVTGTFEEAGWHIDASGTVNSGQLLSRFLTGTTVKSAIESLVVESTLTIT